MTGALWTSTRLDFLVLVIVWPFVWLWIAGLTQRYIFSSRRLHCGGELCFIAFMKLSFVGTVASPLSIVVLTTNGNAHVRSTGPGILRALTNGSLLDRMLSAYRRLAISRAVVIRNFNNRRMGSRVADRCTRSSVA